MHSTEGIIEAIRSADYWDSLSKSESNSQKFFEIIEDHDSIAVPKILDLNRYASKSIKINTYNKEYAKYYSEYNTVKDYTKEIKYCYSTNTEICTFEYFELYKINDLYIVVEINKCDEDCYCPEYIYESKEMFNLILETYYKNVDNFKKKANKMLGGII